MSRTAHWMFALLLSAAASAQADEAAAPVEMPPRQLDGDGFSRPLDQLKFNPGLDQREFERATLDALNMYDPWESTGTAGSTTSTIASTSGCSCPWYEATSTSPRTSSAAA